ncbi:hypothetical protein AARAC_003491 [Aspergillus arachidicola]|uniref:Ras-GEF domain-containing protein n=2 Tax=Aspergillus arachidicola TaxID=656916 RepID=A0A2G7GAN3_9EURO|nr:hypothetical protein AARAC_003491 [Aspergillus arachidicola]
MSIPNQDTVVGFHQSPPQAFFSLPETGGMIGVPRLRAMDESMSATSMSVQSSYPSLFQSSAEIPPFFVTYRWWEDEATTVLWAFDVEDIKRVIQYGLYRDENLPRSSLQSRNASAVDSFLLTLVQPKERAYTANLSFIQKVEEIIRRCKANTPSLVAWSWFPPQVNRDLDPVAIADAIDAESHLHFSRIPFEELVRYSLGYPAIAVEWFLQQHTALYIHLLNYFNAFPEETVRYTKVEHHLRNRSPFAHRALLHCLLTLQSGGNYEIPNATPGFEFIADPIQGLFKELPPSLTSILKVLSVLRVRFERQYVHARTMNWIQPFDIDFSLYEDLTGSTSAADFARTLTNADERSFSALTPQQVMAEDPVVTKLLAKWESLSIEVWECCTALPDMIPYIQDCVQALLVIRNYHSFSAIINGLQKYSITDSVFSNNGAAGAMDLNPIVPPDLLFLTVPYQNYAAYRQQFQSSPGIPCLIPHIREYQQQGQPALLQMFQRMRNAMR